MIMYVSVINADRGCYLSSFVTIFEGHNHI